MRSAAIVPALRPGSREAPPTMTITDPTDSRSCSSTTLVASAAGSSRRPAISRMISPSVPNVVNTFASRTIAPTKAYWPKPTVPSPRASTIASTAESSWPATRPTASQVAFRVTDGPSGNVTRAGGGGLEYMAVKAFARIFALVPDCHTSGRYMRVWRRHFYDGLQAALPSVVLPVEVDFAWARPAALALPVSSPEREAISERLWDQIRTACAAGRLDAVISYCFTSDVDPALIERTVELGVPWINFFCDSTYAFDRVEAVARVTSLNWFPEQAAVQRYHAVGRPVLCRPYAVHPGALPEASCETAEHALGFVGAP